MGPLVAVENHGVRVRRLGVHLGVLDSEPAESNDIHTSSQRTVHMEGRQSSVSNNTPYKQKRTTAWPGGGSEIRKTGWCMTRCATCLHRADRTKTIPPNPTRPIVDRARAFWLAEIAVGGKRVENPKYFPVNTRRKVIPGSLNTI